ncbi:MAG: hypothetical protein E5X76_23100 [Mesorhizobium sp.]|uniref:HEAT repeat domain-containing protein n=1 Tax=Mesorhizobium sp. TaxID=1871066 RepID=UPI0012157D8D|nr:hypothetical protein [Mesorhizobium sp.]TIP02851.1 MAG: hypothetical protein E5X72_18800 [Mesorhizobium sp.]TIP49758.1 MAG: hypothetical protein E5X77_09660 [Mesorhizobium sp.]TJV69805.1 MAG: hypothetical protein E5X76_23100 [Mesorhizobium sp.]
MNTVPAEVPEFMARTFDWREDGFHFAGTPPAGLMSPAALSNSNPWIVLAAVVERAKHGDHSQVPLLSRYYEEHATDRLAQVALMLTGDIGRERDLQLLAGALSSADPLTRVYAAQGAALAGRAWLVPPMLEAWDAADTVDEHAMIGARIADLLEEPGGELIEHADIFPFKNVDRFLEENPSFRKAESQLRILAEGEAAFPRLVEAQYAKVTKQVNDDAAFLWRGSRWSMRNFVDRFLAELDREVPLSLPNLRHRFEAYTGLDCTGFFYVDGDPDLIGMAAVLDDFLESGTIGQYAVARRHFFGHPIPD